jgi:dihydroorotase
MTIRHFVLKTLLIITIVVCSCQNGNYDIVIKGGHVIDPKNNIDAVMDVAIKDNKIARVAQNIDEQRAGRVIDAKGLYVTPGLIDIHAHVFIGTENGYVTGGGRKSVQPDAFSFRSGVTTMIDCGSSGYRTFLKFKETIIDNSQTRVLALINIVGEGLRGGPFEQNPKDMIASRAAEVAKQYPDIVVGFKLAHYNGHEWGPTDSVVRAGNLANLPVVIDFGSAQPPLPIDELLLQHLRPGDVYSHVYAYLGSRESIIDENGIVRPSVFEAVKRGIKFDVGYGELSFRLKVAVPALEQGFIADVISTDLHAGSMNKTMKDMPNIMSQFLALGLPLQDVINRSTWQPALMFKRPDLGNLSVGSEADIALLSISKGDFWFADVANEKIKGTEKLVAELTIRAGSIVWDLNARAATEFKK